MNRNLRVTDIYADNRSRIIKNGINPKKSKKREEREYILFRVNRKRPNIPVITLNVNALNDLIKNGITTPNNNKTPILFVYEGHKPES